MKKYILHFAENFLELNSKELENKKKILEYLKNKGQIEIQKILLYLKTIQEFLKQMIKYI